MQIAVQVAVTFAKVARCDYPRNWPGLLGDLAGRVRGPGGPGALPARRAFLVLHHILKELSSRRLMADQRTFAEVRGAPVLQPPAARRHEAGMRIQRRQRVGSAHALQANSASKQHHQGCLANCRLTLLSCMCMCELDVTSYPGHLVQPVY